MTYLADYHLLTVDDQLRVLERMLADKRDDIQARADRYARKISTPSTTPYLPAGDLPLDHVAAGNFIQELIA